MAVRCGTLSDVCVATLVVLAEQVSKYKDVFIEASRQVCADFCNLLP